MRELLIITFISSWTPLKGVLAKLSYCSHEKQFRLPVHLGEEKEMVHPKAKATIPPLSFHQDKCLPLQCYQTHTHSHGGGGGVVPCHWWYIVALERDILLCCRKQMDNPFPATVWRLKFKSNATFKQMSEYKIKTVLSMPGFKQRKSTVWHLGVIFSLRVFMPSYKINLVIVRGEKKFKKSACEPTLHKQVFFFLLSLYIQHPLRNLSTCSPNPIQIRPRTLANMIKTLSSLTLPSLPCCQWPSLLTDCVDVPYH